VLPRAALRAPQRQKARARGGGACGEFRARGTGFRTHTVESATHGVEAYDPVIEARARGSRAAPRLHRRLLVRRLVCWFWTPSGVGLWGAALSVGLGAGERFSGAAGGAAAHLAIAGGCGAGGSV
jgi:hypothetical protein